MRAMRTSTFRSANVWTCVVRVHVSVKSVAQLPSRSALSSSFAPTLSRMARLARSRVRRRWRMFVSSSQRRRVVGRTGRRMPVISFLKFLRSLQQKQQQGQQQFRYLQHPEHFTTVVYVWRRVAVGHSLLVSLLPSHFLAMDSPI